MQESNYPADLIVAIKDMQATPGLYLIKDKAWPDGPAVVAIVRDGIIHAVDPAQELRPDGFSQSAVIVKMVEDKPKLWLIWCFERSMWWRPGENGYTTSRSGAGRYHTEDAMRIVNKANVILNELTMPEEAMVPA